MPRSRALLMLLLPMTILFWAACERVQEQTSPPVIRPVRHQQVFARGGVRERIFSGMAKASAEIKLSFKVSGTLNNLPLKVGDIVREGDLVADLDTRDYELQVQDVAASLAQNRAQERYSVAEYERVRGLYENNNASKAELEAARTAADSAKARVASTEKKLELAELQLSYTELYSPVQGAVAERQVEVNENVRAGQTIILLTTGARPEVEVAIPENLISEVSTGASVRVSFDSLPERTFRAVVTEVGVTTGNAATTFPVTVRLNDPDYRIRPGMTAEVTFRFGRTQGVERFVVPPQAVGEGGEGIFVYVVERQEEGLGTVHKRAVRIGELVSEGIEILEGLDDGDVVIIAGVSRIHEGQTVKLINE